MNEQSPGGSDVDRLDLCRQSVRQHFSGVLGDGAGLDYLSAMDVADGWAFDHERTERSHVTEVVRTLARVEAVIQTSVGVLHHVPKALVRVLARMTTSRAVRVTGYVARHNPQALAAMQLADENFENDPVLLEKLVMQRRLMALERAGILARVFSQERLGEIGRILNPSADEGERDGS